MRNGNAGKKNITGKGNNICKIQEESVNGAFMKVYINYM